jgi:hypothetical protein
MSLPLEQAAVDNKKAPAHVNAWDAWFPQVLPLAIGIPLGLFLWGKTGEILQDFGNDLYFAWQLSQGKALYRPLSPWINAGVMRALGTGVTPILYANLAVLIACVYLIHRLMCIVADRFTAAIAVSFFLGVFALTSPTRLTNYNFLTPYAHQATHGFLICLAVPFCIDAYYRRGSMIAVACGGFLTGLALLTKPEIFLGCSATFSLGMLAAMWLHRFRGAAAVVTVATTSFLAVLAAAVILLCLQMRLTTALNGIFGGWLYMRQPYVLSPQFYRGSLGIDQPWSNFLKMIAYALLYGVGAAILGAIGVGGARVLGKSRRSIAVASMAIAAMALIVVICVGKALDSFWRDFARGLPIFAVIALILIARGLFRSRRDPENARQLLGQFSVAVWGFVFLAKIILDARLYEYGFVLAAPATLLGVAAAVKWYPEWIERNGGSRTLVCAGAIGVLLAVPLEFFLITRQVLSERTQAIPLPNGQIALAQPFQKDLVSAIDFLRSYRVGTLAVIPDEVGLNYAARLPNPQPYVVLNPMTMKWYGETNVIEAFNKSPPRFILVVADNDDAFGAHRFGVDFGIELRKWIESHYQPVAEFSTTQHPARLWMLR